MQPTIPTKSSQLHSILEKISDIRFLNENAMYVRVLFTKKDNFLNYHIREFEVYGEEFNNVMVDIPELKLNLVPNPFSMAFL